MPQIAGAALLRRRTLQLTATTAVVAMLLAASCTSLSAPSRYEELLGRVPDAPETRSSVLINDYALARQLFKIPLPGRDAGDEALLQYIVAMLGAPGAASPRLGQPPWISGFDPFAEMFLKNRQHLAFDVRNVDQSVLAGGPPGVLEVIRGHFDPAATDRSLLACSECEPPVRQNHSDVSFYTWGGDFETNPTRVLAPPAFDRFGRGGRIAVQEAYVFRTVHTEGMESLIDASNNKRLSLAQVEDFRLLARGMSNLDAYAAFFSDRTQRADKIMEGLGLSEEQQSAEQQKVIEAALKPLLRPYRALAIGAGKDDTGPYMAIVLVHRDSATASENAALLPQRIKASQSFVTRAPWTELIDGIAIRAQGRVIEAKLRGRIALFWFDLYANRDSLLVHEVERTP